MIRDFEVRNEAALAELDAKGRPRKSGPRKDGLAFKRLTLPFTTDARFLRLGDDRWCEATNWAHHRAGRHPQV